MLYSGCDSIKSHLDLQLFRIRPEVVPLAYGEVPTPDQAEQPDKSLHVPAVAVMVFLQDQRNNPSGIPLCVIQYNSGCPVRGTVVPYDNFNAEIRFLRQDAVQAFPDILFLVVCRTKNADRN